MEPFSCPGARRRRSKKPALPYGRTGSLPKLLLDRVYAHTLAVLAHPLEPDGAVRLGEQGIVGADPDVQAGVDMGAALAHQDIAREHKLPVGPLDAQAFGFGIPAVFGGSHSFFMGEQLDVYFQHVVTPP